ncbi:MAG TPA: cyclopropane-fatty-acyl-phospholipid synthase family protein [Candidatus Eisenbacteria bacterium]|nr:cyclopropane-fatty-acyl-phospholipid synthase family protein [Candidatus Eisenbacteria bacterium]
MKALVDATQGLLEKDVLPDFAIRWGIRTLLEKKLEAESAGGEAARRERRARLVEALRQSPIAVRTAEANGQHYELPTEFFELVLGPRLKYSSGWWAEASTDLGRSELDMLELTARRAALADGQRILELGCGWGSLSLFMAERFPAARITAVSNSRTQKAYIDARARERGLPNLRVVTADMNDFEPGRTYDRVVSVEMFEHMRNYGTLFGRISNWLEPGGRLFVHIFTHREYAYLYEDADSADWMARHFFSGGTMPSDDLLLDFKGALALEERWTVPGTHYQKTCEAWLERLDRNRARIEPILRSVYGGDHRKWRVYWRVFFMACAELFGYGNGEEWRVSHYRFVRPAS